MQMKKGFRLISILAILATAAPAPHLAPAAAPTRFEEKRQLMTAITVQSALLLGIAVETLILVAAMIAIDIEKRKIFTIAYIQKARDKIPGKNIVICNVNYSLSCTPVLKQTVFYHTILGKSVSYDVLVFEKGCTFDRKGDGGFQNWAYYAPTGCQIDGGHIAC